MRIRSIKPEFWRSDDITALDWHDRLIFIGLWSYVDDNGVGLDKLASVVADLFAGDIERDSSETFARVSRGLQNLSEAGRITRYTVDGRRFLSISNWDKHQRIDKPNKDRYPLPACGNAEIPDTLATGSRDTRETPAPGTEEQGNRGTEEQRNRPQSRRSSSAAADGMFDVFWKHYPRKVGKDDARRIFARRRKDTDAAAIIAGAKRLAADPNLPEKQFIPHPATWLQRGGWDDEPLPAPVASGGRVEPERPGFWNEAIA